MNHSQATLAATGSYAPVNGLEMYYEIHGSGQPLVLIHGGFGMVSMFQQLIPALAATRQVIAVELQGHGHTADINRAFSFEAMSDDIAALIRHLGHEKADLFGYSLGGGVALFTAIRHPETVRKLVLLSVPHKSEGWYPEVRAGMSAISVEGVSGSFMHEAYTAIAPKPDKWPVLVSKTRALLNERPYDLSAEVAALQLPVLIIAADADGFSPAHAAEMFALLGGGQRDAGWDGSQRPQSQLAILPGVTHYSIFMRTDLLVPCVLPFLDAPLP